MSNLNLKKYHPNKGLLFVKAARLEGKATADPIYERWRIDTS